MNKTILLLTMLSVYAMHAGDGNEVELVNDQLFDAAENGHVVTVRELLDRGVNIETRTPSGSTSLHLAAMNGHIDTARELLNRGADFRACNYHLRDTPLHSAIRNGHAAMVQELLDRGADPAKKNWKDQTPANLAQAYGYGDLAQYIRNYEDIPVTKGVMEDFE